MADRDDEESVGVVVGALAGIVLVAVGAIFAKGGLQGGLPPPKPALVAQAEIVEVDIAPIGEALTKLYFGLGVSELPAEAATELEKVLPELAKNGETIVLISGFHDESGSAAQNAAIARDRARAVHTALAALGVPADRLKMRKPESTLGDGNADEARRVEIRVQ